MKYGRTDNARYLYLDMAFPIGNPLLSICPPAHLDCTARPYAEAIKAQLKGEYTVNHMATRVSDLFGSGRDDGTRYCALYRALAKAWMPKYMAKTDNFKWAGMYTYVKLNGKQPTGKWYVSIATDDEVDDEKVFGEYQVLQASHATDAWINMPNLISKGTVISFKNALDSLDGLSALDRTHCINNLRKYLRVHRSMMQTMTGSIGMPSDTFMKREYFNQPGGSGLLLTHSGVQKTGLGPMWHLTVSAPALDTLPPERMTMDQAIEEAKKVLARIARLFFYVTGNHGRYFIVELDAQLEEKELNRLPHGVDVCIGLRDDIDVVVPVLNDKGKYKNPVRLSWREVDPIDVTLGEEHVVSISQGNS